MAKFNKNIKYSTKNLCGHDAYAMNMKELLVTQVLTSMFCEEKFYGDNTEKLLGVANEILDSDAKFVVNLVKYCRKEMHLRSVSHALTALIAYNVNSKEYIKEVVDCVTERPDDITEILAFYIDVFGKPIPNGLKKALGLAIGKFNAYSISKYNGGNKSVKFRDVLKIAHPVPKTKEQEELFNMIATDTLPIAERWETEVSKYGNKKEVWEKLIDDNKLGFMAMLRNLRNIINANPYNIDKVYEKLSNKEEVLKSKQLPFRFLSAYLQIIGLENVTSKAFDTLETAISYSMENIPNITGKTIIAIDTSGSMRYPISRSSTIECSDIACLLGAMVSKLSDENIAYTFNTELRKIILQKNNGIISSALDIPVSGGGTDISLPLIEMLDKQIYADRLILLSDNMMNYGYRKTCQHLAQKYREQVNPNLWVHAIDLQGYGTQQFIGKQTNIIAGWSEQVLEFIYMVEKGMASQVEYIENYNG